MKIKCSSCRDNILISIFIPNEELVNKELFPTVSNEGKDLRIKRSFHITLSQKNCETVELLLSEMFNNFQYYYVIHNELGTVGLIEAIQTRIQEQLDEYQRASIKNIICNIAIPIVFNRSTSLEVSCLRTKFDLTENDLIICLVGGFGFGKTTLIKKLLNFDDSFRFLLVDNGRTTIYNTYVRGMIVDKDGKIHCKSDTDEMISVSVKEYEFKNRIFLHSKENLYRNVIIPSLEDAFIKSNGLDEISILKEFIKNDSCPLDGLLGKIDDSNAIGADFYQEILKQFKLLRNEEDTIPNFVHNDNLKNMFFKLYEELINKNIKNLNSKKKVIFDRESGEISFTLSCDDIAKEIDNYYRPFTDNSIKSGGMRICVKEIYLETDFHVDTFLETDGQFPETIYDNNGNLKYPSFLFVDTVGCGHEKNSQNKMQLQNRNLDPDLQGNADILNESDIIFLLDKATDSMQQGIMNQLFTLEMLGLKSKVLLIYSYYNQFIKSDMESDDDRMSQLQTYLESSLKALYPAKDTEVFSKKAELYYHHFADQNRGIVYLKGLVPKIKNIKNPDEVVKKSRREIQLQSNSDDEKADILNEKFKNSELCLIELINKSIELHIDFKENQKKRCSIQAHHKEIEFQINYINQIYNILPDAYLSKEDIIYHQNPPAYNTTSALCRNAVYGQAVHYGVSVNLCPVIDFASILQIKISNLLDSVKDDLLVIEKDEEGHIVDSALTKDFLIDEIKSDAYKRFSYFLQQMFVVAQKKNWVRLSNECGNGVKIRRANGIYNLLKSVSKMDGFNKKILELLIKSIDKIVNDYKS